ncbi:MAG: helix-turn-helix domain-containing protein [Bacteroidota bacterium]|jgi:YesN/AraC family two-component response regulator
MAVDTTNVKLFVDQNIKEVKTIHNVARKLNMSYDTLRKSFLRKEQVPLADYITMRKVQAMQEFLLLRDDPCFYVCYEFGYREDSGAKIFKKKTGMTMREFREKNKSRITIH